MFNFGSRLVGALGFSLDAFNVTVKWLKERKSSEYLVETEDEHLPWSYKLVWILNNINSSLSLLITIGGEKNIVKKSKKLSFFFQCIGVCCITVRDTLLTMRTSLDMDSSLWFV